MKTYLKLLLCMLPLSFTTVHAATIPAETWHCTLKDGKTMDDVRAISQAIGELSVKNDDKDAQWIFMPFSGDIADSGRFILMTGWQDFRTMGDGFQTFFAEGDGDDIYAKWNETVECSNRNFWTIEEIYNRME